MTREVRYFTHARRRQSSLIWLKIQPGAKTRILAWLAEGESLSWSSLIAKMHHLAAGATMHYKSSVLRDPSIDDPFQLGDSTELVDAT